MPQSWTSQPAELKIEISMCRFLSLWYFLQQPKWTKEQTGLVAAVWLSTHRTQHSTLDVSFRVHGWESQHPLTVLGFESETLGGK